MNILKAQKQDIVLQKEQADKHVIDLNTKKYNLESSQRDAEVNKEKLREFLMGVKKYSKSSGFWGTFPRFNQVFLVPNFRENLLRIFQLKFKATFISYESYFLIFHVNLPRRHFYSEAKISSHYNNRHTSLPLSYSAKFDMFLSYQ